MLRTWLKSGRTIAADEVCDVPNGAADDGDPCGSAPRPGAPQARAAAAPSPPRRVGRGAGRGADAVRHDRRIGDPTNVAADPDRAVRGIGVRSGLADRDPRLRGTRRARLP